MGFLAMDKCISRRVMKPRIVGNADRSAARASKSGFMHPVPSTAGLGGKRMLNSNGSSAERKPRRQGRLLHVPPDSVDRRHAEPSRDPRNVVREGVRDTSIAAWGNGSCDTVSRNKNATRSVLRALLAPVPPNHRVCREDEATTAIRPIADSSGRLSIRRSTAP
jgi:hypothetical protein